jgi:hypothetical protein
VIRLWRGVKGYERIIRGIEHFPENRRCENLKGHPSPVRPERELRTNKVASTVGYVL